MPGKLSPLLSIVLCLTLLLAGMPAFAQDIPVLEGVTGGSEETTPPAGSISTENTDPQIAVRLLDIYRSLEGMEEVRPTVAGGVVTLAGEVLTPAGRRNAEQLALSVEGVVGVDNNLRVSTDVVTRLEYAYRQLMERLESLLVSLPFFLIALLVVVAFWFIAAAVVRFDAPFRLIARRAFLIDLLKQITRVLIVFVGILIGLQIMDATALLGALIGAAGLFGLAMGFAMRDTVENYIASILLSFRQPFSPNDHVRIGEHEGKVLRLTTRATILMDFDGDHIRIPNAHVYKGVITNFSRNPHRRFNFEVGVDTTTDLTTARNLVVATLSRIKGVVDKPPPACLIKTLGDTQVILDISGWTDQRRFDYRKVKGAAMQAVKEAFDNESPPAKASHGAREAVAEVARSDFIDEAIRREAEGAEDLLRDNTSKE